MINHPKSTIKNCPILHQITRQQAIISEELEIAPVFEAQPVFTLPIKNSFVKLQLITDEDETIILGDSIIKYQSCEFAPRNIQKRKLILKRSGKISAVITEATGLQTKSKDTLIIIHVRTHKIKNTRSEELIEKYKKLVDTLKENSNNVVMSAISQRTYEGNAIYSKIEYINKALKHI